MELLTAKEVKSMLRVSLPMIYKLAERGKLPCVRFGIPGSDSERQKMCLRFKRADVLEFIEAHYSGETT